MAQTSRRFVMPRERSTKLVFFVEYFS